MLKRIRAFVGGSKSMILAIVMLGVSAVVCILTCWLQMYLSAVVFFVFGVGIYWYIRLIRDERKGGVWYEVEDAEIG